MSKWGYLVRKEGTRYYMAETFAGVQITGFKRVSLLKLNDIAKDHDISKVSYMTVALNARG